mgnify:FL=1
MTKKKILRALIVLFFFLIILYFFLKDDNKIEEPKVKEENLESSYSLNIIENVNYSSKDVNGNEYIIIAKKGEIDASDSNIIFLTKVDATIKLVDGNLVLITSDYGKYNTNNFDTIFSKNVIVNYLENEIVGEYLDFSILRNTMIIRKNVKYSNSKNTLFADVIEMDIETKDTKIYMHEGLKKVNIKSKE